MDMHMDGAWDTFWIKSQNGTFIALQMKSFGPKKFKISSTGKKVPFWQFFRMGWDGRALLGRPSRIPHRNWKIIFFLSAEFSSQIEIFTRPFMHQFETFFSIQGNLTNLDIYFQAQVQLAWGPNLVQIGSIISSPKPKPQQKRQPPS